MKFTIAALVAVVTAALPLSGSIAFASGQIYCSMWTKWGFGRRILALNQIRRGDIARRCNPCGSRHFLAAARCWDCQYLILWGDPFEALKIADVLNKYFVGFATGFCGPNAQCDLDLPHVAVCASACALIYLAANTRYGDEVFLHRPSFPAIAFGSLPAAKAESLYNAGIVVPPGRVGNTSRTPRRYRTDDEHPFAAVEKIAQAILRIYQPAWRTRSPPNAGSIQKPDIDPKIPICEGDALMAEQHRAQCHTGTSVAVNPR